MIKQDDTRNDEIWKDISGYEGHYQVSNLGRVKSLKRHGVINDKILKPHESNSGYLNVGLWKENRRKPMTIHKLVMLTFIGERPDGLEVNHIDGNKANNHLSNLEYCTPIQNTRHAIKTGLHDQFGEQNKQSKLTESQVLDIRARYNAGGISQYKLAHEYGVNQMTICKIVNRKTWKHI